MTTLRNTSLRRVSCKLTVNTMCLCLGPKGSGKTLLLKKLQNWEAVDTMSSTVPTIGTNLVAVPLGNRKEITIREIGGAMSPIWRNYYYGIESIMYVVDASNLCQISAAGVLLYTILAEPCLQKAKILLVLSKMDASYRQMRNEALLMLQLVRLKKEILQDTAVVEASAMTGEGIDKVLKWLQDRSTATANS
ncbi:ADP-ribosylation factor-like protein 16 [Zootermopsis nevadensis]|uniref:ADP-ribosylation factor-like protein 16 n=1 Tax=Zootermopsis nevadensis TaxID=136037 RepID=A0A067QMC7_ZOONE|nr:ADP-ribosylation factor-like protein 16 [Zootermopsis nevadensis]KDR10582.1 ADP-ribosylation factor-like protein 16 [Zootermopsis nevadensis]